MANDEMTKPEAAGEESASNETEELSSSSEQSSAQAATPAKTTKKKGKRSRRKNRAREVTNASQRTTANDQEAREAASDTTTQSGVMGFVKETKEELSKVFWPSRQQLISESVAVMLMVTLVATTIYFIDNFFVWGAGKIF